MEQVVFADSRQGVFSNQNLKSFDDFFEFSGGVTINKNNKRDVQKLTFPCEGAQKIFFMKRFHNPHFKDMLFAFGNFGRLCSQAVIEWRNINLLLQHGIETYRPVCFGEKTICGIERKSFIVTEELKSQCLTDFVAQNWSKFDQTQKEGILKSLGQVVRKVHDAAIGLTDLYIWHIFITENEDRGGWEFAFIDLHRMKCNVTEEKERIRNLGRLDHTMLDKYFDKRLRRVFYQSYAGDDWVGGVEGLIAKVKKYSEKISSRRNQKRY